MNDITTPHTVRPLRSDDLAAVVAIDAGRQGRTRRVYVERRLQAALREPAAHVQMAAVDERGLAGFMLGRVLDGEFGRSDAGLRLELLGVRPELQGRGFGRQLLEAITGWARRHGVRELHTAASWRDTRMLHWLSARGFDLAPITIVERNIEHAADGADALSDPAAARVERGASREVNFARPESNDFEREARTHADVRAMVPADLAEIARIDQAITGRDRSGYIGRRLQETMSDSAVRVSLTARLDGAIAGFLMARTDWGDFGRPEPVAVIDTLGVDPGAPRRGVGRALLRQLNANLDALGVEGVETVISHREPRIAAFFIASGFEPSQRLAFVRRLP